MTEKNQNTDCLQIIDFNYDNSQITDKNEVQITDAAVSDYCQMLSDDNRTIEIDDDNYCQLRRNDCDYLQPVPDDENYFEVVADGCDQSKIKDANGYQSNRVTKKIGYSVKCADCTSMVNNEYHYENPQMAGLNSDHNNHESVRTTNQRYCKIEHT